MQPSSDQPTSGGSKALRRYGPLAAIVVVVAVVITVVVVAGGGDDGGGDDAATETTVDLGEDAVSFDQAEEQGLEVDWPDTCDTETGNLAIPNEFAPDCYVPFDGDNGGATDVGVTADTIRIAYYQSPPNPITDFILGGFGITDTNAEANETIQTYIDMFQQYAETYGRTVELVPVEGSGPPNDDVAARADAVRIDEEIQPFMVWGGPILTDAFADELAARHIPCISCELGESEQWVTDRAPYVIQIANSPEQARAHVVEWLSKQVAGRPASFAGEDLQEQERSFGYLYIETDEDSTVAADATEAALNDAGVELTERIPYELDPARLQEQAANAIARFKDAGVTSIIFTGDPVAPATFTTEATNQDYFPEWIITGSALVDTTAAARSFDQQQWAHAFGISPLAARISPEVSGSFFLYEWYTGEEPPAADTTGVILPFPQVFYAALQGVGPNLTRENWVAALLAGEPTPSAISQPSLDWGDDTVWGDHTDYFGIDDWTAIWWDADAVGPSEIRRVDPGMYEYVDGGTRYLPGAWPEDDSRAFDPEGAVDFYEQAPPGEEAPQYPSPAG